MLSSRQLPKVAATVVAVFVSAATRAEDASVSALKARDIERLLSYAALRSSPQASGGGQAGGGCLFEDADDDGMADSWESGRGLDPADPDDAWFDPDGDHVINLFEFQLESDPHSGATPPTVTVAPKGADFTDVGSAIDAVAPGTVIRVAGETYLVNYITFQERVVMIQGGWSADFTQRDLRKFPTTFDGQMRGEILYFSNSNGNPVIILDGIQFISGSGFFGAVNLLAQGTACMKTSILNCIIRDSISASFGGALLMLNWESSRSDRTLANTLIVNNSSSGIYSQVVESGAAHWRIIHTTISGNTNGGGDNGEGIDAFTLFSAQLTAHIYNSIVWGNDPDACDIEIHGFGGKITFDVDHSDIGVVCTLGDANFNEGEGVVDLDPLFVDPAGADYHLQEASPLVDDGIPLGIPLTDFEGDPRNVGAAPDMGAYEFQGLPDDCGGFPCGHNDNKVLLCHVPPGNPGNEHTLCISPNAVAAHLENHDGDHCGPCGSLGGASTTLIYEGDIGGDGAVGITDFLLLFSAWGLCPEQPDVCPADLDLDSVVGVTDLLILLMNWDW